MHLEQTILADIEDQNLKLRQVQFHTFRNTCIVNFGGLRTPWKAKNSWEYDTEKDTWKYTKLELSRRVFSDSKESSPMSKIINVSGTHLRSRQHSYISVEINNDVVWSGAKSSTKSCQDEWID